MTPLLDSQNRPLYVLRYISTKVVINSRAISNTTGVPNPGTDQEFLPIVIDVAPPHDPQFTVRSQIEGPNEEATPKRWEITYKVEDRPKAEQIQAIENAKRFEVQKHFPMTDAWESIIIVIAALGREIKLQQLTPDESAAKERLIAVASKLTANRALAEDMKAAANAGQKPDISEGVWAPVETPVTP